MVCKSYFLRSRCMDARNFRFCCYRWGRFSKWAFPIQFGLLSSRSIRSICTSLRVRRAASGSRSRISPSVRWRASPSVPWPISQRRYVYQIGRIARPQKLPSGSTLIGLTLSLVALMTLGAREDGRCSLRFSHGFFLLRCHGWRVDRDTMGTSDVSHICPYTSLTTATWVRCLTATHLC